MAKLSRSILIVLAVMGGLLSTSVIAAPPSKVSNPDFTKGEAIPEGATHDWNLGPTGARGWMYSNKLETSEARQIMVTEVDPGSPADGVLKPGDVILGAAGRLFKTDPRTELGRAIGIAEASSGRLVLINWRDGRRKRVTVKLPVLGRYAATAPFDCPKSTKIFERGCAALAQKMAANPEKGTPIERCYNALALLASGNPDYLPLVRQQVESFSTYSDLERRSLHSWWYGPINILMAEYVLATGDRTFMPDLERITMEIVNGQSEVGSWGHRMVQSNGRLSGYGMMNAPGLPLTISMVLARKAGVENPELDEAIEKSARLMRFYVGKGSVPYGDHHPWIQTHDDNGKNGAAAILFNLLADAEAAEYFSRMSVASHGNERDNGHTGNYFNMLWAMPGVALSGSDASGAWMEEFGWYYDLARRWDGTFRHQGPPQAKPDSYRNWDATGAMLLAYAQPLDEIHLTGRTPSTAPELDRKNAESLVADGRDWGSRTRLEAWSDRSDRQLLRNLESWSPVVRERAAIELARRDGDPTSAPAKDAPAERSLLPARRVPGRHHARRPVPPHWFPNCEARSTPKTSGSESRAAEALAAIGGPAMSTALPDLLDHARRRTRTQSDPRGMQQRYLCFALFNRREGMLGRSLEGVDPDTLQAAIAAGLQNQDGRARGTFDSVYRNLSLESIKRRCCRPFTQAIVEPAPSGIMFADEIRLSGLDLFAKHGIAEGVPWCVTMVDPERWGMGNRIERMPERTPRLRRGRRLADPPTQGAAGRTRRAEVESRSAPKDRHPRSHRGT